MSLPLSSVAPRSNNVERRLRIAVLNRTFSTMGGGAERYSIALVEQLAARHEIHVFAQEIDHQWPGVTYHRVSAPLQKPRWVNQLWFAGCTWWTTRQGFDVVHSHENTWHGDVQTVHVLPVKYNLFRGRSGCNRAMRWLKVVTSPRLLTYLGLEWMRYAAQPGRRIVVTSDSLKAIMSSNYPGCSEMLSVITPGITMPHFTVTVQRKAKARALLGLPVIGWCLLFVANDYRKKGLQPLLEALSQLPEDVLLAVVGNSAQISLFSRQVKTLKLDQRVFFLGSLKDLEPAYEAADCLAHPTLEDTFAMVVMEAMSYGLPVVVSGPRYCGIAGLLLDGINAVIIDEPKDAFRLYSILEQILNQPALQKQLSQGATAFAKLYEWRNIALKQETLYFSVFAGKNTVITQ
ncbi:MAG: glycosyltransferase family 4 protein [Polaromonas sp.]